MDAALQTSIVEGEPSISELEPGVSRLGTNNDGSVISVGWTEVAGSLVEWADSPGNKDVKLFGRLMHGVVALLPKAPRALTHLVTIMTHRDPQRRPSMLRVADLLHRLLSHMQTHQ
ncbi:hypothetical protein Pcinc_024136 [Petrolisthes cinctipes]|uniref:Protein kinase domain-containing protein n=1 Tax=Petrolisthes cinctipes TaxID=88211 RepID=A0AAE1FDF7_PETCI|nr:hypothetical protein Pcinc_024136 [Petrolisthes cinctipes]